MHRALYRTWRPQTFDDVCGQKQITDILKYQVSEGKTSHAYLFCGSRGTGKTTCAKILAKAVNCLNPVNGNPCNRCEACRSIDAGTATDVIEMDAASNNGVDNVRDLKEEIVFMPASLKYRVYIIDEVHMMSPSAFNALLKTLEEPPTYVLFILATTELNKLPSTIVSRCQRCDFRRIGTEIIVGRLQQIAGAEGMTLLPDGARMIARAAQGGMRDAVSLLELCGGAHVPIDEALVTDILGAGNRNTLYRTVEAIWKKDYPALYSIVDEIVMSSGDLAGFWSGLGDVIRDIIVAKTLPQAAEYLDLTDGEYERIRALGADASMARLFYLSHTIDDNLPIFQKTGVSRRASLEVALTRMCDPRLSSSPEALVARIEEMEREVALLRVGGLPTAQTAPVKETAEEPGKTAAAESKVGSVAPSASPAPAPVTPSAENAPAGNAVPGWRALTEEFGNLFPGYASLLTASRAAFDSDGTMTVSLQDNFLLGSFERDSRAVRALLSLAGRATGTEVKSLVLRRVSAGQPPAPSDEEFF